MIAMLIDLAYEQAAAYANYAMRLAMDGKAGDARKARLKAEHLVEAVNQSAIEMGAGPEGVWRCWDRITGYYTRGFESELAAVMGEIVRRVEVVYGPRYG